MSSDNDDVFVMDAGDDTKQLPVVPAKPKPKKAEQVDEDIFSSIHKSEKGADQYLINTIVTESTNKKTTIEFTENQENSSGHMNVNNIEEDI